MANELDPQELRRAVFRTVADKLTMSGHRPADIDESSKLMELGLIDSEDLIEIILEVEQRCGCQFDPEELDFENGLTLGGLIGSFVARR